MYGNLKFHVSTFLSKNVKMYWNLNHLKSHEFFVEKKYNKSQFSSHKSRPFFLLENLSWIWHFLLNSNFSYFWLQDYDEDYYNEFTTTTITTVASTLSTQQSKADRSPVSFHWCYACQKISNFYFFAYSRFSLKLLI